jgi:hypothetical protein
MTEHRPGYRTWVELALRNSRAGGLIPGGRCTKAIALPRSHLVSPRGDGLRHRQVHASRKPRGRRGFHHEGKRSSKGSALGRERTRNRQVEAEYRAGSPSESTTARRREPRPRFTTCAAAVESAVRVILLRQESRGALAESIGPLQRET